MTINRWMALVLGCVVLSFGTGAAGKKEDQQLLKAAEAGDVKWVKEELKKGADIMAQDEHGNTPLHKASLFGNKDAAVLLLQRGADVDARNKAGGTPLHLASLSGSTKIVEALLKMHADVNIQTPGGATPLHNASLFGKTGVVKVLIKHDAHVNQQNSSGATPLHLATKSSIVKALLEGGANPLLRDNSEKTLRDYSGFLRDEREDELIISLLDKAEEERSKPRK